MKDFGYWSTRWSHNTLLPHLWETAMPELYRETKSKVAETHEGFSIWSFCQ